MKIFVCNSGRCGSFFMSEIFRKLTAFPSFHEPMPRCDGETLRAANNKEELSEYVMDEFSAKRVQIGRDSRDGNYFESSQMFIKSFDEVAFNFFDDVYVIYLYRNPIEVALSWCKKRSTQEPPYNSWHLQSHWDNNILKTRGKLSYYQNCLWECLEIRERFLRLYWDMPPSRTFEFDFKKLNNVREWKELFRQFEIKHKSFDTLPKVAKNAIPEDRQKTFDRMMADWDEPGNVCQVNEDGYEKWDRLIDTGQRIMIQNERRLNAHALR